MVNVLLVVYPLWMTLWLDKACIDQATSATAPVLLVNVMAYQVDRIIAETGEAILWLDKVCIDQQRISPMACAIQLWTEVLTAPWLDKVCIDQSEPLHQMWGPHKNLYTTNPMPLLEAVLLKMAVMPPSVAVLLGMVMPPSVTVLVAQGEMPQRTWT